MTEKPSRAAVWEISYRGAGPDRLWPQDPTIEKLDLDAWSKMGVRSVLDAGCGDGKNLSYLLHKDFFVLGADASASALQKCRSHLEKQGSRHNYILLSPTPLHHLPLLDDCLDAIVCVDVLGHVEKPLLILHELARVLRPGGFLYASIFHVDDGCRIGPRMRAGKSPRQLWYHPSGNMDVEYYFRFYDESEAHALFESSGLVLQSLDSHHWHEPPHPGYRDEPHEHQSWFALLQKHP